MTEIVFPGVSNRVGNSRNRRGRGGGGGGGGGGIVVGVSNKHPLEWTFSNGDGSKAQLSSVERGYGYFLGLKILLKCYKQNENIQC